MALRLRSRVELSLVEATYVNLFYKAGALSLGSAALLGWLITLQRTNPNIVRKLGIKAPKRILQLHIDQVLMGLILIAAKTAFPDLPDAYGGPLLVGTFLNPLGFVPMAFSPGCEDTLWYRGGIGFSFISSTIGFVGMAYWAFTGAKN